MPRLRDPLPHLHVQLRSAPGRRRRRGAAARPASPAWRSRAWTRSTAPAPARPASRTSARPAHRVAPTARPGLVCNRMGTTNTCRAICRCDLRQRQLHRHQRLPRRHHLPTGHEQHPVRGLFVRNRVALALTPSSSSSSVRRRRPRRRRRRCRSRCSLVPGRPRLQRPTDRSSRGRKRAGANFAAGSSRTEDDTSATTGDAGRGTTLEDEDGLTRLNLPQFR